jgi:hypothetical protein
VICEALATGQQTIILRKGGIHEGREGFRVEHPHFWLFPTYLHQEDQHKLAVPAWHTLRASVSSRPIDDRVTLRLLAEVTEVIQIHDETVLPRLAGLHWWSDQTVHERFHYRQPGLFLLIVRIYKSQEMIELPNSPHFAGCRSWVDLPQPLSTAKLTPVLSDEDFRSRQRSILAAVAASPV